MIDPTQSSQVGEPMDPPAPFHQTSPGVLKVTRGGGAISLFGTPFFLAGVFMLLGATGIFPMRTEASGTPTILAPMGLLFLTVGGVLVFGRQWLVLDLARRSIQRQIGLLVPLHTEERTLSDFHAVVISHDPGDSESAETYPVRLRASTGRDAAIVKPTRFAESLVTAQYLARVLSLQLVDATTDRETIIAPEHAGESLRERLSRAGVDTPPPRPLSMRSDVTESVHGTRIVIPGGNPTLAGYAGIFLPIVVFFIAMLFAIPALAKSQKPLTLFCMLLLLFGVPTVFAWVRFMVSSKHKGITVTASSTGLVIEPRSGKSRSSVIPSRDVFDVDCSTFESAVESARQSTRSATAQGPGSERVLGTLRKLVPNPGIVVKSRNGLITFAEGLSEDELRYLVWMIRRALIG